MGRSILRVAIGLACAGLLAGCKSHSAAEVPLTRVGTVTVRPADFAPAVTFTGDVAARVQTDLAFEVSGKISERLAGVGEHVAAGQLLARLDPEQQQADVAAARASVASAEAALHQARAAFDRQRSLLATGNTTRRDYDQAEATLHGEEGRLRQAQADLATAQDVLSHTELRADADGIITRQGAEVGQVVAQAQLVYSLARDGPRDAVFKVHQLALLHLSDDRALEISLVLDPAVRTTGQVREISPAIDRGTQTVAVKVGLRDTPPAMSLGALVNGAARVAPRRVIMVPWSSLFDIAGKPAVWVIDRATRTVSLRPVVVERYVADGIALAGGLQAGELVVSAGVQLLHPGQQVEMVAGATP
jgi:RND family efflux transporter MFP subunit